jgi:CDP-diacylglycerol--glycerol-3-phosphate 3-phosphatidyltransferase
MIIISRDLIVTGLRLVAAAEGVVLAASIWGKIKTLTQMVAIVAIMLDNFPLSYISDINFGQYVMIIAVAATIYSGIDYIRKNINILNYNE